MSGTDKHVAIESSAANTSTDIPSTDDHGGVDSSSPAACESPVMMTTYTSSSDSEPVIQVATSDAITASSTSTGLESASNSMKTKLTIVIPAVKNPLR